MSKLPIARIFETALIAKAKSYQELQPFIEWVQSTIEIFFRTLNGQVTIAENLNAELRTLTFKGPNLTHTANLALRGRPVAVLLGRQSPTSPAIERPLRWEIATNGQTTITVDFSTAPTAGVAVTVLAFFG